MSQVEQNPESRDLILERLIDAPPEKVFCAWTDAEILKQGLGSVLARP